MLQQKAGSDYILATGREQSLKNFVEKAFGFIGIKIVWQGEKEKLVGLDEKTGRVLVKSSKKFYPNIPSGKMWE